MTNNFPLTTQEFLAITKGKKTATLKESVADALIKHIGNPELNAYLQACRDDDSRSGKVQGDQLLAAHCLQQLAVDSPVVALAKTWEVMNALKVVLRRYGLSPQQRLALAAPSGE